MKRIIGETGRFKDWGGETSDLYTTRLRVGGGRKAAAFGFKGKGLTGVLTPARMGKMATKSRGSSKKTPTSSSCSTAGRSLAA